MNTDADIRAAIQAAALIGNYVLANDIAMRTALDVCRCCARDAPPQNYRVPLRALNVVQTGGWVCTHCARTVRNHAICRQDPTASSAFCLTHQTTPDWSSELWNYQGPTGWICSEGGLFAEESW